MSRCYVAGAQVRSCWIRVGSFRSITAARPVVSQAKCDDRRHFLPRYVFRCDRMKSKRDRRHNSQASKKKTHNMQSEINNVFYPHLGKNWVSSLVARWLVMLAGWMAGWLKCLPLPNPPFTAPKEDHFLKISLLHPYMQPSPRNIQVPCLRTHAA